MNLRHKSAAMPGDHRSMRALVLAAGLTGLASLAHADPVQEARSATAACLSAVIDGAPVEDIDGDDVNIRRGRDPVSCTVQVFAGEPVVIRDAVETAIKRRGETFSPARTAWAPGRAASRVTWCNLPGRRALGVIVTTAKPGLSPVLTATVFETVTRDTRCDQDQGIQNSDAPQAATAAVDAPAEIAAQTAKKKKKRLLGIPGLFRKG